MKFNKNDFGGRKKSQVEFTEGIVTFAIIFFIFLVFILVSLK
jgi:hypothetical protein